MNTEVNELSKVVLPTFLFILPIWNFFGRRKNKIKVERLRREEVCSLEYFLANNAVVHVVYPDFRILLAGRSGVEMSVSFFSLRSLFKWLLTPECKRKVEQILVSESKAPL